MTSDKQRSLLVSMIGDASSFRTHSGTQAYFIEAARQYTDVKGVDLNYQSFRSRLQRLYWAGCRILNGEFRPGGAQYDDRVLEGLWDSVQLPESSVTILNFFQLFPDRLVNDNSIERFFYIDLTLRQLFKDYGCGRGISRRRQAEIFHRERRGYVCASHIFVMSTFVKDSLERDYSIDPKGITTITPGANLQRQEVAAFQAKAIDKTLPLANVLTICFVGKDWFRKGLDRLIEAVRLSRVEGCDIRVRVVGLKRSDVPQSFQDDEFIDYVGTIDKHVDVQKFIDVIASCDVGCLLSRADASPIALLEYQSLGLPVIFTDVGGCREMLQDNAGIDVKPDADAAEISRLLSGLAKDRVRLAALSKAALDQCREVVWDRKAFRMLEIMRQSREL